MEVNHDLVKPGVYKHFKGNIYHVIGVAENTETKGLTVIYIPQKGEHAGKLSNRDLDMFLEEVDRPELNYKGPRFVLIEECKFLELRGLMEYIGSRYIFAPEHYSALAGMSSEQGKAFAVGHSTFHMCKSIGKIAAECERFDHGGNLDDAVLKEGVIKMLINVLKLAEVMGISPDDLGSSIPNYMTSK
jgi:hypothetical protein